MPRKYARLLLALLLACGLTVAVFAKDKDRDRDDRGDNGGAAVIAQISDIHMGLAKASDAAANLQRALDMIAQRHVDAIIVSGDIGERAPEREKVKQMVESGARGVPVFWVAGNHDDSAHDTNSFTDIFGKDYYEANVKFVKLIVLDSQLLGNYDNYNAGQAEPLAAEGQGKSQGMLGWLRDEGRETREARGGGDVGGVVIAVQHVPLDRGSGFPQDSKPYWTSQEPYRSQAVDLLHRAGVRDILSGHLHHAAIYKADGFTIRLAPAIGYPIGGGSTGFAIHTIKPNGDVDTQFVDLQ